MSDDLIERLKAKGQPRAFGKVGNMILINGDPDCAAAAVEIERLRTAAMRALNFIQRDNPDYAAEILEDALGVAPTEQATAPQIETECRDRRSDAAGVLVSVSGGDGVDVTAFPPAVRAFPATPGGVWGWSRHAWAGGWVGAA